MTDSTHVLYRFYNATGQLLYVGITMNPPQRFKSHGGGKEWWSQVAGITVESYNSRADLEGAERRAIQVERPLYNIVHNHRTRKLRTVAPERRPEPAVNDVCDCGTGITDEMQGWHRRGVRQMPGDFLSKRLDWVQHPRAVRVVVNGDGWDVMLRIDGTYYVLEEALEVGHAFLHEAHGMAAIRMDDEADYEVESTCPTCAAPAIWSRRLNRHFHRDGTGSADCWAGITSGSGAGIQVGAGA